MDCGQYDQHAVVFYTGVDGCKSGTVSTILMKNILIYFTCYLKLLTKKGKYTDK